MVDYYDQQTEIKGQERPSMATEASGLEQKSEASLEAINASLTFQQRMQAVWSTLYGQSSVADSDNTNNFGLLDVFIFPLLSRPLLQYAMGKSHNNGAKFFAGLVAAPLALAHLILAAVFSVLATPVVWLAHLAWSRDKARATVMTPESPKTLPKELGDIVLGYVDGDLKLEANFITKVGSFFSFLDREQVLLSFLLERIVRADYDGVKTLLDSELANYPDLLKQTGTVYDHNGYDYKNLTALQLALKLRDVDVVVGGETVIEGLAELITAAIREQHGEEEVQQQSQAFFENNPPVDLSQADSPLCQCIDAIRNAPGPNAAEKRSTAVQDYTQQLESKEEIPHPEAKAFLEDMMALCEVTDAIRDSDTNEECEAAFEEFRAYFKPNHLKPNHRHTHPEELLLEAIKLFDQNDAAFGGYNSRKNKLFCIKVIGYLQRLLPACSLQVFAQGLYAVIERHVKLKRTFEFSYGGGRIFPSDASSGAGLGFNYYAGGGAWEALGVVGGAVRRVGKLISSKKTPALQVLRNDSTINRNPVAR